MKRLIRTATLAGVMVWTFACSSTGSKEAAEAPVISAGTYVSDAALSIEATIAAIEARSGQSLSEEEREDPMITMMASVPWRLELGETTFDYHAFMASEGSFMRVAGGTWRQDGDSLVLAAVDDDGDMIDVGGDMTLHVDEHGRLHQHTGDVVNVLVRE